MDKTKPFNIPKALVWKAFHLVKANNGCAGIDHESISEFEQNMAGNLYKLWNRLSSGTYFPPAVRGVAIPKKQGGTRMLGIPTVTDRIAQMTIKLAFEPWVEPYFLEDSYGYRPNKSALDAIGVTRKRCWSYDWLLEFDIRGLFDNIQHDILMKAVRKHTNNSWVILYIERWLKAPMCLPSGEIVARKCGTPQGGVISPVLSNLFLHYVFDMWMNVYHKNMPWCRYADDGIVHCKTEAGAQEILDKLSIRFKECGLEIHPEKTKIVYCKDNKRNKEYHNTQFKFLGYDFRSRNVSNPRSGEIFRGFTPAISAGAKKEINSTIRKFGIRNRTELELKDIALWINPIMNGWLNYYGKYHKSGMYGVIRNFNRVLAQWASRKYKRLHGRKTRSIEFIRKIAETKPNLFAHWRYVSRFV